MSTPINDRGPAFPNILRETTASGVWDSGMTLRDWFAGQALAGLMADPTNMNPPEKNAEASFNTADAMLAARAGKETK